MVQKCFASPTKNKGSNGQKLNDYQAQLCYLPITGSKVPISVNSAEKVIQNVNLVFCQDTGTFEECFRQLYTNHLCTPPVRGEVMTCHC